MEVRVAIIGAGVISHRHMLIYKNMNEHAEMLGFSVKVAAVAEIDEKKLKAWAEQYGMDEKDCYVDYRKLLQRDDIDTVDVCVHNNLHTPISIDVMKHGFDCYCEKPAAASYHDTQMMIDCAKKLGRKFHVQISSLMTPQTRVARDMIANGELGDVYYGNIELVSQRNRPGLDQRGGSGFPVLSTDFYSSKIAGHGKSIDHGVYHISHMLFIAGLPELQSVSGFAKQALQVDPRLITNPDGYGVEDISEGLAKFKNGFNLHFLATSACHFKNYSSAYILGTKGGLELKYADGGGGKWARPANLPFKIPDPELTFYGEQGGREVEIELQCDKNGQTEVRLHPEMQLYNDNQCMWLAYHLGILDDNSRYNTPEIASQMLLVTDGIFLSQELGREVTAEEIKALSPELYVHEQEIAGEMVHFDTTF